MTEISRDAFWTRGVNHFIVIKPFSLLSKPPINLSKQANHEGIDLNKVAFMGLIKLVFL